MNIQNIWRVCICVYVYTTSIGVVHVHCTVYDVRRTMYVVQCTWASHCLRLTKTWIVFHLYVRWRVSANSSHCKYIEQYSMSSVGTLYFVHYTSYIEHCIRRTAYVQLKLNPQWIPTLPPRTRPHWHARTHTPASINRLIPRDRINKGAWLRDKKATLPFHTLCYILITVHGSTKEFFYY